jgi:hypothetical protein
MIYHKTKDDCLTRYARELRLLQVKSIHRNATTDWYWESIKFAYVLFEMLDETKTKKNDNVNPRKVKWTMFAIIYHQQTSSNSNFQH